MDKVSISTVAKATITSFLERLNVVVPTYERDLQLEQRVAEITKSWTFRLPRPSIVTAITLTITAYLHIQDLDTRALITLFTAIATTMDSPEVLNSLAADLFHGSFAIGSIQQDSGMLGEFARCLSAAWKCYPRFAASAIMTSSLNFVDASIMENTSSDIAVRPGALAFVEHRRIKTGAAEAYAHFIWDKAQFPDVAEYVQAIPDANLYVDYVNDILSFYKEELAGETPTYIQDRALACGQSRLAALHNVIDDTIAAVERVRTILGEGCARDAWEGFVAGYIGFHMSCPRYRLSEVTDAKYIIV
ncbi:terpenoid synthase [Obba rivulosa]|uniref:Terpenoid synthase n=1 Tax=Obba rivulosa TaxID=1052685 RepID=A0A8E2DLB2_9APHY|nr:terpenoid synthase [Obba rivulosa]